MVTIRYFVICYKCFSQIMGSHAEPTMQPDHYYMNTTNHQCYSTKTELTKQLKLSLDTID